MLRQLHMFLLILLGAMIAASLLTMMVTFTGRRVTGADLSALLLVQAAVAPLALLLVARDVASFVRPNGWRRGLAMLWHRIPAWLVLALVLLNALVLVGELSMLLLNHLLGERLPWIEHVPLLSLLACSLAFAIQYGKVAHRYGKGISRLGRWP